MRPKINLTDIERDAIKEYAVQNGYTMPKAYSRLIRHALYDRFSMRVNPGKDSVGVKFSGYDSHILTNVSNDLFKKRLEYYDGDWVRIYSPRVFALERAGIDVDLEPTFWIDQDDWGSDPKAMNSE